MAPICCPPVLLLIAQRLTVIDSDQHVHDSGPVVQSITGIALLEIGLFREGLKRGGHLDICINLLVHLLQVLHVTKLQGRMLLFPDQGPGPRHQRWSNPIGSPISRWRSQAPGMRLGEAIFCFTNPDGPGMSFCPGASGHDWPCFLVLTPTT